MVSSVAIREGVHKSLEITAEHFQEIYGKKIRFSIYNTKNKSNIVNIKSFANTSNIEVMIMNYQAFATRSKESRKIYQKLDAIDAYNQKLVKKINVKGIEVVGNSGTNSYLFLDTINIHAKQYPTANIELEIRQKTGIKKKIRQISEKDDLFQLSDGLAQYKAFLMQSIINISTVI